MIQEHIKQKILEESTSLENFGLSDPAWEQHNAKKLINALLSRVRVYVLKKLNIISAAVLILAVVATGVLDGTYSFIHLSTI